MPKKTVILRADGNSLIGLGHLYRIRAFYDYLTPLFECILITRDFEIASKIFMGLKIIKLSKAIDKEAELKFISNLFSSKELIVLDGYQFDSAYQLNLKTSGFNLVYIDDMLYHHIHADLVINHALGINKNDYKTESYTQFALGSHYSILRKEFIQSSSPEVSIGINNTVFVCFGGADPLNLNELIVESLLSCDQISRINLVSPSSNSDKQNSFLSDPKVNLYHHLSALEMVELMNSSHFAVAPASTISYELCMLKIPSLIGYYVENQINLYQGLISNNAAFGLGDLRNAKKNDITKLILDFLDDEVKIAAIRKNQEKLFDNFAENRLRKSVFEISSGNIELRRINEGDVDKVFEWSNDFLVRQQSFSSDPIKYSEHIRWFNNKLSSNEALYYIAEIDEDEVAFLRFDQIDSETVIGISIDKKYRGLGLSSKLIKRAVKKYVESKNGPVFAYIKSSNLASINAFIKAGFHFQSSFSQNEIETFKYIYR